MKICNNNLKGIEGLGIKVPAYERNGIESACVHIGLGHFHRSHFLKYMDDLLSLGCEKGGVFEIDVLPASPAFIKALKEQDYMYSLLSLAPDGKEELKIIGAIAGYANLTVEPAVVMDVLSAEKTRLISLTITEKGYHYLDDEGTLDWDDADTAHDLKTENVPKTAIGCLALALQTRMKENRPLTVMSCDNIPENGKVLETCILQFCKKKYPESVAWIKENVAFPCTMVDRITPGTRAEDARYLAEKYGLEDGCPVHCEDFMQWVIEDKKATAIPDFSRAGALVVDDVKPYELMKIRLLNGSHSALSYPSHMMNISMVHDAIRNPLIGKFIRERYMEEITQTLPPVPGVDLEAYKDSLVQRFSNANIADTILRLASDGSKKIANAILRPLEEALSRGLKADAIILALALWQHYFTAVDDDGKPMPIDDPKKDELLKAAQEPKAFLETAGLSRSASCNEYLLQKMQEYLGALKACGVEAVLRGFLS